VFLCAVAISVSTSFISPVSAANKTWDGNITSLKYADIETDQEPYFDSVPVYAAPSDKGKLISELSTYETPGFLVDPNPIVGKTDKSTWYKVIFVCDDFGNSLQQVQKSEQFNFSYPYVNAKFLKLQPAPDFIKEHIVAFQQKRPVKTKVGHTVAPVVKTTMRQI
jgi:hypothetical protein